MTKLRVYQTLFPSIIYHYQLLTPSNIKLCDVGNYDKQQVGSKIVYSLFLKQKLYSIDMIHNYFIDSFSSN